MAGYSLVFSKHRRLQATLLSAAMGGLIIAATWHLETKISSPRKRFYVLASSIKQGDSLDNVKSILGGYHSWSSSEGYMSFNFTSRPSTTDVVVVHYDPKTSKVIDADLSLD